MYRDVQVIPTSMFEFGGNVQPQNPLIIEEPVEVEVCMYNHTEFLLVKLREQDLIIAQPICNVTETMTEFRAYVYEQSTECPCKLKKDCQDTIRAELGLEVISPNVEDDGDALSIDDTTLI